MLHPTRTNGLRRSGLTGLVWFVAVVGFWLNPIAANAQCEVQTLTTDDTVPPWQFLFGSSVAASEDHVVVGATYSNAISTVNSGFAYVYRRDGTRWIEEQRLSPSDGTLTDHFGDKVAISGDRVAVSAWGLQAVYVFRREAEGWVEEAKLVPWDAPAWNDFGRPIGMTGDVIVVGAEEDDEAGARVGAAYVYRRTNTSWLPDQKLLASDAWESGGSFGRAVALDGDYILVADPSHVRDEGGTGWVYVFRHNGNQWIEEQMLIGSDTAIGDSFGNALALNDNLALIGAPYYDGGFTNAGAAYVFRRESASWVEECTADISAIPARVERGIMFRRDFKGRAAMPSMMGSWNIGMSNM